MTAINCKEIREQILEDVKKEVKDLSGTPKLAIITIGDDDASKVYVRNKIKTAEELGIEVTHYQLDGNIDNAEACFRIQYACADHHAVMLQLPIPEHLDKDMLINWIPQHKDVDGLTDLNMGMLVNNREGAIVPATAQGVFEIIKHHVTLKKYRLNPNDLSGFDVAILNRSQLIGKPLQALLTNHNATVRLCHSRTNIHDEMFDEIDYIVLGTGNPKWFDSCFEVQDYHTLIDCSICRDENGKLCGDLDIDDLLTWREEDFDYTTVPGGVGILTTACLMKSVVKCYKLNEAIK